MQGKSIGVQYRYGDGTVRIAYVPVRDWMGDHPWLYGTDGWGQYVTVRRESIVRVVG